MLHSFVNNSKFILFIEKLKTMKIEKSKAQEIIKEEVERFQKLQNLYEQKKRVLIQLKEMCGEGEVDEGKIARFFGNELTREKALSLINGHKGKKAAYEDAIQRGRGDAYVNFFIKNPHALYAKWDEQKQEYVDAGEYFDATGILAGKE